MSDPGDLRLAVLSTLIGQHGPIPCIHVTRTRTFSPGALTPRPSELRKAEVRYYCEASELRLEGDTVVLELPELDRPLYAAGEPERYEAADEACKERDRLCASLECLPWDRTSLGRVLSASDAAVALRHVQASPGGVKILPGSTSEISGWTFENHTGTSSGE